MIKSKELKIKAKLRLNRMLHFQQQNRKPLTDTEKEQLLEFHQAKDKTKYKAMYLKATTCPHAASYLLMLDNQLQEIKEPVSIAKIAANEAMTILQQTEAAICQTVDFLIKITLEPCLNMTMGNNLTMDDNVVPIIYDTKIFPTKPNYKLILCKDIKDEQCLAEHFLVETEVQARADKQFRIYFRIHNYKKQNVSTCFSLEGRERLSVVIKPGIMHTLNFHHVHFGSFPLNIKLEIEELKP